MSADGHTLTVVIPLNVKPRGGRKAIIAPGVMEVETRHDITLIKAVARAFRWLRMLETGRFATIAELAAAEKISASYVARILRLALLAPEVVEAILDGRQPEGMTLPGLMKGQKVERGEHVETAFRQIEELAPSPSLNPLPVSRFDHCVVGQFGQHRLPDGGPYELHNVCRRKEQFRRAD